MSQQSRWRVSNWLCCKVLASSIVSLVLGTGVNPSMAIALTVVDPPPDMQLLNASNSIPNNPATITADTIHQGRLTRPSLWWAQQQFGGKLVQNWVAYPEQGGDRPRVDLVVNRQIWSLLSYLERYTFLSQFGTAARDFGYSTRLFNQQGEPLAAYICTFPTVTAAAAEPEEREALASDSVAGFHGHGAAGGGDEITPAISAIPSSDADADAESRLPSGIPTDQTAATAPTAEMAANLVAEPSSEITQQRDRLARLPNCSVDLDSSGAGAFRGRSSSFGEF